MRIRQSLLFSLLVTTFLCCFARVVTAQPIDRKPVWAGKFYPGDPAELRSALTALAAGGVQRKTHSQIIAIIAPHAGYVYSGGVAASAYNQLAPAYHYDNVFILGPSHHVGFEGAAVYADGNFQTPLGTVEVNTAIGRKLAETSKTFSLRRDAHAQEHCIEVQLPFLQYRMGKGLRIVPIVVNAASPTTCRTIAQALAPYFTPKNLFVISSDFSHYPPYEDAKRVDKRTGDAIVTRSPETVLTVMRENARSNVPGLGTSMCGWPAVLSLLYLLENDPDARIDIIDYKNSGDVAAGSKDGVVGYYAMAVTTRGHEMQKAFDLTTGEKIELLKLARTTIGQYIRREDVSTPPASTLPKALTANAGAFVTLRKGGDLRGCIGRFDATESLFKVVQQMAISSSTEDNRFRPVTAGELDDLEIEISVLTPMRRIKSVSEFELGKHGIYMRKGMRAGTFLPQVAAETGWSTEEFLGHCARDKAGIGWEGWKDAELYVYEAIVFGEKELRLR